MTTKTATVIDLGAANATARYRFLGWKGGSVDTAQRAAILALQNADPSINTVLVDLEVEVTPAPVTGDVLKVASGVYVADNT